MKALNLIPFFIFVVKSGFLLFGFSFLLACVSSHKTKYDSLEEAPVKEESLPIKRNVAYLKQISQFKEDSFEFISNQMKDMIKNYERMKEQLEKIEKKIDRSLNQNSVVSFSRPKENGESVTLTTKDKKRVVISLSSVEDYTKLMAQIIGGEYDIGEEEKEKLLLNVKNQLNKVKTIEQDKTSESEIVELIESKELDGLDEDSLGEEINEEDVLFQENQESANSNNKNLEKDKTILKSAKKYFEEQSYETAISEFQKYRNENPEGRHYPEATFYIGQSFEKLKMPIEAKVFFKEVIKSHPQSLWASRARKHLEK